MALPGGIGNRRRLLERAAVVEQRQQPAAAGPGLLQEGARLRRRGGEEVVEGRAGCGGLFGPGQVGGESGGPFRHANLPKSFSAYKSYSGC